MTERITYETFTPVCPGHLCTPCQIEWARMRDMHVDSEQCWCHPTLADNALVHHEPA